MLVYLHRRALWRRRMNAGEPFESLLDGVRTAAVDAAPPRPSELAARTFTWTGSGRGPVPPVER